MTIPRITGACRAFRSACLFLCLLAAALPAAADDGYLAELQSLARTKGLAQARTWEVLLHYKSTRFGGTTSLVTDATFFNSPNGKSDREAELFATLASFFTVAVKEGDEHPQCRFIARYTWLSEQLAFDNSRLPQAACPKFEKALAEVSPRSLVLVYPSTLLNNPSSMFGHTLLRINTASESDLLSHAVSYAAITGEHPGFAYALKGLFGFYPGRYSNLPYFAKVSEYTDMEQRDIWEYHLMMSREEAYKTFLHTWEMKEFYSDYYFFDANCSFELLFLIEAGRPSLRLTDAFYGKTRFWVIPVDTVRVLQEVGLVERVSYRPSLATKSLRIASTLDAKAKDISFAVVEGKRDAASVLTSDIDDDKKRAVLDLAAEMTQIRLWRREIEREPYQRLFLDILTSRSTLGPAAADAYPVVVPERPDKGHHSGRFRLGGGYRTDQWFEEFEWRAAYHELADFDEGYVRGAQINFFDWSFRYYNDDQRLRLHRWRIVDIVSLFPWNSIFKPVSWKVLFGVDELLLRDGRDHPVPRLNAGGGLTLGPGDNVRFYLFGEGDLQTSTRLEKDYAFGVGGTAGMIANIAKDWKVHLWTQALFYGAGDEHRSAVAGIQNNFRITTDTSISLDAVRERSYDIYKTNVTARLNVCY